MRYFTRFHQWLHATAGGLVGKSPVRAGSSAGQRRPTLRARPDLEELEGRLVPVSGSFTSLQDALNQFQQVASQGFASSAACQQGIQNVYNAVVQFGQDNGLDPSLIRSQLDPILQQAPQTCARFDQQGGTGNGNPGKNHTNPGSHPTRVSAVTSWGISCSCWKEPSASTA